MVVAYSLQCRLCKLLIPNKIYIFIIRLNMYWFSKLFIACNIIFSIVEILKILETENSATVI